MEKEILDETEVLMNKSILKLKENLSLIRAGRVNPRLLEKITVMYYDVPTPLLQLCQVTTLDSRTLLIQPWDKTLLKEVEKAILKSELGITPANDGNNIRLVFPPLSEERRKELVKFVHREVEDSRVAIRSIRRNQNEHLKDAQTKGKLSEDLSYRIQEMIQKLTDKYILIADDVQKAKEKEIMEVS